MKNAALYVLVAATILLSFAQFAPTSADSLDFLPNVRVAGRVETYHADDPPPVQDYMRIETSPSQTWTVPDGQQFVVTAILHKSTQGLLRLLVDGEDAWTMGGSTHGAPPEGWAAAPTGFVLESGDVVFVSNGSNPAVLIGYLIAEKD